LRICDDNGPPEKRGCTASGRGDGLPEKQRQRMLLHVVAPADDAHGNEGKGEKQNKTKKVPKFYFIGKYRRFLFAITGK
jgi:hypothetical protein